MNYTNANDPDYQDKPEDWLNSALIFSGALGNLLQINEGVVVELKGDMKFQFDTEVKKVIVFRNDSGQIIIEEADHDISKLLLPFTPIFLLFLVLLLYSSKWFFIKIQIFFEA